MDTDNGRTTQVNNQVKYIKKGSLGRPPFLFFYNEV